MNNVKQLCLACTNYQNDNSVLPPAVLMNSSVTIPNTATQNFGPNWAILILPYIEQSALFTSVAPSVQEYMSTGDTGWHSIVGETIPIFLCPTDAAELAASGPLSLNGLSWARGNYGANTGPGMFCYDDGTDPATQSVTMGAEGILVENIPLFISSQAETETYIGLQYPGGGVFIVNSGHSLADIADGTSCTIMIDELRIGPANYDLRGTWALGQAGASISAGNGRFDTPTPNVSQSGGDDIEGGDNRPDIQMGCDSNASRQVSAKSRHQNGVVTGFSDGHVEFIGNSVSQGVWFLLHSRNDGQSIPSEY